MLKAVREGAEKAGFEPIRKYINKFNMNMQKQTYLSPETETLVVRFEGIILTLSDSVNQTNHTQYLLGGPDDDYEEL